MYRHYYARFYNYGKKFIADEMLIEDAAYETLLMVWEKRDSIPGLKFPDTYFYTTFRNKLITLIRQQKIASIPEASLEEPGFNAEQMIIEKELNVHMRTQMFLAIQQLTPRQREVIFLRYFEGLSYEEVAEVIDITTKATYKIVARALAALKEIMSFPTLLYAILFAGKI